MCCGYLARKFGAQTGGIKETNIIARLQQVNPNLKFSSIRHEQQITVNHSANLISKGNYE